MKFLPNPARNRPSRRMAMVAMVGFWIAPAIVTAAPEVVIDCQQIHLPSQRAVAELLQIDNVSRAYLARAHLMEDAKRACNRTGVARVRMLAPGTFDRRIGGLD